MFCTKCGVELTDSDRFCSQCGTQTGARLRQTEVGNVWNRLSRPRDDRKLAGVCAGLARYLGVDVSLVRILTVVLSIWPIGLGVILYIVCWIVMPNDPVALPAAENTPVKA
jgi:phage shock protein C